MKKAFTLMEIIIVIVLLGIMASLAIPKVAASKEQAVVSEAVSFLHTLHGAQKRYALENSGNYTNDCANLDVDNLVPKNFDTVTCANIGSVSVTRIGGAGYVITKSIAGTFSCSGTCTGIKLPS